MAEPRSADVGEIAALEFLGMIPAKPSARASHAELGEQLCVSGVKTMHPELTTWRCDTQRHCVVQSALDASVIAQLPTGFGKSLIAIVPAVAQGGFTHFVAPTLSLINHFYRDCRDRQVFAFEPAGASAQDQQKLVYDSLLHEQGGILLTTPEKAGSRQMSDLFWKLQLSRGSGG